MRNNLHRRLADLDVELYIRLQDQGRLDHFLEKFQTAADPQAALSESLSAARFDYIAEVLEEEFIDTYLQFSSAGILRYEILNMITACEEVFEHYRFPENTGDRMMRYAAIGTIDEYLKGGKGDGL